MNCWAPIKSTKFVDSVKLDGVQCLPLLSADGQIGWPAGLNVNGAQCAHCDVMMAGDF